MFSVFSKVSMAGPVTVAKIDALPQSWISRRVSQLRVGSPTALASPL
jgi:hypothetical protein